MKCRQRRGITFLLAGAVIFLLIGGGCYFVGMQRMLAEQIVAATLEVTSQGSHSFEVYIEKDMESVENLARGISQYRSDNAKQIISRLKMFDDPEVYYSVIDLTHGMLYSNHMDSGRKLAEEELAVYEELSARGIMEPYQSEYVGQGMLGYYERFTFADGSQGIVQKEQLLSAVSEEFSLSFFENTGFSYVVNERGDVLICSGHENCNQVMGNIMDVMELSGKDKESKDEFQESIQRNEKGVIRFEYEDEEYILTFVPVNIEEDWYLVSIIPNDVIVRYTDKILRTTRSFISMIGIAFLVFVSFLLTNRQYHQNMQKKEAEVNYREELFSLLANNTDDVYLMLSGEDYAVEYVSPNIERVLGITQDEVRENLSVLRVDTPGSDKAMNYSELRELAAGDCAVYERERIHKKSGERKWFRELVYCVTVDKAERLIAVLQDQTEHKQEEATLKAALENTKAANDAKSNFLSNMSHDIRTPMNAIVGFVTLLKRDANNPELVLEYAQKITTSSQHLLGLINDVLDMSKIESGKTTLNISEINLAEIVKELSAIMMSQVQAKQQEFELLAYDVKEEHLLGDKLRINQVLINILSNAVKYTPVGGRIEMEIRQLPAIYKKNAHLCFIIRDNGIGMSEEYLKNIFQPFTREDNSAANRIQGTGLGMAITKNLVELMGGTISVQSRQGEGTTFKVELELRIQEQSGDKEFWKEPADDLEEEHSLEGKHFLAAEDNALNSEIIVELLDMMGATCELAGNGREAVQKFEESQPGTYDAILMDVQMPVMNGYEATRAIRAGSHPDAARIPIVAMTANAFAEDVHEAMAAGMNAHIAKPLDVEVLQRVMKKLAGKAEK